MFIDNTLRNFFLYLFNMELFKHVVMKKIIFSEPIPMTLPQEHHIL